MSPVTLSKSRYTAGLQCDRMLWWRTHERDAPELAERTESEAAVLDRGDRIGELARTYVPGGVLIDLPYDAHAERVAATRAALDRGERIIYEASFFADDVFVAVDILERLDRGWALIEVKSSTKVKEQHYPDATIQAHVLRRSGIDVTRVEVMHLNRDCAFPDLSDLFTRADITQEVEAGLILIHREVERQLEVLRGPLPAVPIGRQCKEPYECPFIGRCWAGLPRHHVTTLYQGGAEKFRLMREGFALITDVPEERVRHAIARRQLRAVRENRMIVEPGLAEAVADLSPPLAVLDFETAQPAVPVWPGCHPYDQIPVQFSCHIVHADGSLTHSEWLAEPHADPRAAFAHAVVEACGNVPRVLGYHVAFERTALRSLAAELPALATELEAIAARCVDLLPIIQRFVYHPDFLGKHTLKAVLPVFAPEMRHADLAVSEGQLASVRLTRLIVEGEPADPAERARVRGELLAYCKLDTLGTLKVWEALRALARGEGAPP